MPSPRPASDHAIRRAAAEELAAGGVVPTPELARRLRSGGVVLGPEGVDRLELVLDDAPRFVELDGGWASVPHLLEGTTWFTLVDEHAAATGELLADPDLTLFAWWAMDEPLPLHGTAGGVRCQAGWDDELGELDVLVGPDGWLDGLAGRVVGIEVTDGRLHLQTLDTDAVPPPDPAQAAALQRTFDRIAQRDEMPSMEPDGGATVITSALVSDLLWEALVSDRAAFTGAPVGPVEELLFAAGFLPEWPVVLGPDVDPNDHRRLQLRRRLAHPWQLDPRQADMAEVVVGASMAVVRGDDDPLGPPDEEQRAAILLGALLADPQVCRAVWGHHLDRGTDPLALAAFARRLLEHAEGELWGGAGWLAARALDHAGDPQAAEAVLVDAVGHDPGHPLACSALAAFTADRGDAKGAMELLRRAGDHADEDLVDELEPFVTARPRPAARRNDPCPCGSGRKYKACHLGREELPLDERAGWLHAKALRYVRDGRFRTFHLDVARTAVAASDGGLGLLDALDAETVFDVTLCEGGVWEAFLAERGHLLPEDEALLAATWQLVERSVYEVERHDGTDLHLRDRRTGDRLTITRIRVNSQLRPGTPVWGRPLPVGDTWRAFSGILPAPGPLAAELVEALDHADEHDAAELVGRSLAPPRMANTDSQALAFHELTYQLDDPGRARAALVAAGLDGDDDLTLVRDTPGQRRTVVLSASFDGDRLVVSANSDARADEAERLLAGVPGARLVDRDVRTLDEALRQGGGGPRSGSLEGLRLPGPSADSPELVALLERHMRDYEEQWLDLDIPALGGRTPREAAQDPIGRHDLERLIASMPSATGPGAMDPDRLRRLLGLPPVR